MLLAGKIQAQQRLPDRAGRRGEGGRRLLGGSPAQPWLSVVTIALNPGELLGPTMESVLNWDPRQVEYIVIDGGSQDGTCSLLENNSHRIEYWVSEPDRGISDAFNKGISLCRGEVVGLINAGDWYEPDTFSQVRSLFDENANAGVVVGSLQYWNGAKRAYVCESEPDLLHRDMSVTHPTCFVRRQVYLDHGAFSTEYRLAMDYDLLLRLKTAGVEYVRSRAVLANMIHDGLAEQHWQEALRETHLARRRYLPGSLLASPAYLGYLIGRRKVRFLLERLRLDSLVRWYRGHVAAVRKTRG